MGSFFAYILQSSLLLISLYVVYKWFMASENQHSYNRAVLLAIYAASFVLPLFPDAEQALSFFTALHQSAGTAQIGKITVVSLQTVSTHQPFWPLIVIYTYVIGIIVMLILTGLSYLRLTQIIHKGDLTEMQNGYGLILTDASGTASFSWMRYMVISRTDYSESGKTILIHELEHLQRHHWIDMLVAQVVIIFQWFNPAAWLMREELRAVHEYQADSAVLHSGADSRQYKLMLIKKAVGKSFPALANSLNHSKLKKRITMMLKSKSSKKRRLLAIAFVPAAAALAVFNIPAIATATTVLSQAELTESVISRKDSKNTESTKSRTSVSVVSVTQQSDKTGSRNAGIKHVSKTQESGSESKITATVEITDAYGNTRKTEIKDLENYTPEDIDSITIDKRRNVVKVTLKKDVEEKVAAAIMVAPHFPGGDKELLNFVITNIRYPENAPADGKKRTCVVKLEITETGKVQNPHILRSAGEIFDKEALRVVNLLPDFEPAMDNGKPVATHYILPVIFKAQ